MAERDWASVGLLFEGNQYVHTLFFCHLVIEKLLKAHWVRDNEETKSTAHTRFRDALYAIGFGDIR